MRGTSQQWDGRPGLIEFNEIQRAREWVEQLVGQGASHSFAEDCSIEIYCSL